MQKEVNPKWRLKKFFRYSPLLYTCFFLFCISCKRDELCFLHKNKAIVKLLIRYDLNVDAEPISKPSTMYVGIYNADNGNLIRKEIIEEINVPHNIELEVGRYKFVAYNEPYIKEEPISANSVYYSRESSWETISVFAQNYTTQSAIIENHTIWVEDIVISDTIVLFEITNEMIAKTHIHPTGKENIEKEIITLDTTLYLDPKIVFPELNIVLKIKNYKGWTFRRTNGARPYIDGIASSYMLGNKIYSDKTSTMFIDFKNSSSLVNDITTFVSSSFIIGFPSGMYPENTLRTDNLLFLRFDCLSSTGVESKPIYINLRNGDGANYVQSHYTIAGALRQLDNKKYHYDIWDLEVYIELEERIPMGDGLDGDLEDWEDEDVQLDVPPKIYFNANVADGNNIFLWQ